MATAVLLQKEQLLAANIPSWMKLDGAAVVLIQKTLFVPKGEFKLMVFSFKIDSSDGKES